MASWTSEVQPDPKHPRVVADRLSWDMIRTLKQGPCRGCGRALDSQHTHFHHVLPRAQGGGDIPENIIPLDPACHQALHDHPAGWELIANRIRASLTEPEMFYALGELGRDRLDRLYPALEDSGSSPKGDDQGSVLAPESSSAVLCPVCGRDHHPPKREPARRKRRVVLSVPADAQENGVEVFTELVTACAERLDLGRGDDVPPYYTLTAVMADWLNS